HDEVLKPFYQKCLEWEIPVFTHAATNRFPHRSRFSRPSEWGDVVVEFPDLTVILGHAGDDSDLYFEECLTVAGSAINCYLELGGWHRLAFRDPAAFFAKLDRMRQRVGAHRILWGSDHQSGPRYSGEKSHVPRWLELFRTLPETAAAHGFTFSR